MSVVRIQFGLFILAASCSLLWASPVPAPRKRAQAPPAAKHEEPVPQPPAPPLTLEQMPASAPHVEYSNGKLTIVADNSTLGDILRAVRNQTGAAVDVPASATERVVIHLGPGPARQVLGDLLNGTRFNYVMLGSATDPGALQQVILTLKPPPPPPGSNSTLASQPMGRGQFAAPNTSDDADSSDDTDDSFSDNPPDQASPAQGQEQPPAGQPAVKSPQQMLEELQRQLQQQQQQGGSTPGQAPPQQIRRQDER